MIGKTVNQAVKKQLASADKKRKSDDDNDCVDVLTKDLDGFNYQDMEKLSIGTKDDAIPVPEDISDEVSV